MSRYLLTRVVAERAKILLQGSHPLIDLGGKLKRPLDIAYEEIRRGLVRVDVSNPRPPAKSGGFASEAGQEDSSRRAPAASLPHEDKARDE
ncbi:MAG: DNA-directed RNA polymerase subunit omega [Acidobacteriota bacterium]|nr:MAG: DNA-directed RNA polymerase subunit omega [Acidobacteriota bacterium]